MPANLARPQQWRWSARSSPSCADPRLRGQVGRKNLSPGRVRRGTTRRVPRRRRPHHLSGPIPEGTV
ncbi:hypothetical protein ACQRIU_002052 [Beauveria bassiana]